MRKRKEAGVEVIQRGLGPVKCSRGKGVTKNCIMVFVGASDRWLKIVEQARPDQICL